MALNAQHKNWNDLPNIRDTQSFDKTDDACLDEIQAVLEKYNRASRFGVALLHKHFPIGADEVLVEGADPEHRTLTTTTVKASGLEEQDLITTIWRFDGGTRYACSYCKKNHCQS